MRVLSFVMHFLPNPPISFSLIVRQNVPSLFKPASDGPSPPLGLKPGPPAHAPRSRHDRRNVGKLDLELATFRMSQGLLELGVWLQGPCDDQSLKMEDLSSNDQDPLLRPFNVNDLDSPLISPNIASPTDGPGPGSNLWPWSPDMSLDLPLDPWSPNPGCAQGPADQDTSDNPDGPLVDCPFGSLTVCAHGSKQPGGWAALSFDNRARFHRALVSVPAVHPPNAAAKFNSPKRPRAGNARRATDLGQKSRNFPPQDAARSCSAQISSNEPGTSEFSGNVGEMFFDLNMEKVKPRTLKKKTRTERESYLNVRRQGGACEKHKLAKRAVRTVFCGLAEILTFS
jgi:hypothetical protein